LLSSAEFAFCLFYFATNRNKWGLYGRPTHTHTHTHTHAHTHTHTHTHAHKRDIYKFLLDRKTLKMRRITCDLFRTILTINSGCLP